LSEDRIMLAVVRVAGLVVLAALLFVAGQVLLRGLPAVDREFLLTGARAMGRAGGVLSSLAGTAAVGGLALALAAPVGVGTAIYLGEFARPGPAVTAVRLAIEALAGVPSVVFGLFGFSLFVIRLGLGWSILSGGLTLALMILPTIIRSAEESLRAVPHAYRELSAALGASVWQTVSRVVLPEARTGILSGMALALGRSVGETAAVLFTAGTSLRSPRSLLDPARTLSVHFYLLAREGRALDQAYGVAAVLLLAVMAANGAARILLRAGVRRRAASARDS
jgi:phosphate transport system permease protein